MLLNFDLLFRFYILSIWLYFLMCESDLNEKVCCWDPLFQAFRQLLISKKKNITGLEKDLFKISFINIQAVKFSFSGACVCKLWQIHSHRHHNQETEESIIPWNCLVFPLCSQPVSHPQSLCAVPVVLSVLECDKNSPVTARMRGIFPFMAK